MNIYLEIFGYIGTALVLTSMLMTSVVKLRFFNAAGSLVSMIYAYLSGTWPVVFLNFFLLIINVVQLIRLNHTKVAFRHITVSPSDKSLAFFLTSFLQDIQVYFPDYRPEIGEDRSVYMVYCAAEPVGVLIGKSTDEGLVVELDYTTPKYRDCSVAAYLFDQLKALGVKTLITYSTAKGHTPYLQKMGFQGVDGRWSKEL